MHSLAGLGPAALLALFAVTAQAADRGPVTFGRPFVVPDNRGDTWAGAWAADGNLYSPSNDCMAFNHAVFGNLAFSRIAGDDVRHLTGVTVNGMADYGQAGQEDGDGRTWKSAGCYAVDGALYWAIARHKYGRSSGDPYFRQTVIDASLIKSTDGGKTWTRSAEENRRHPMFPSPRFGTPYFVQYGRDGRAGVDNADRYVYAVSNDGFCDNGNSVILGRVRRDKLPNLNGADWQFYIGGDGMEDSAWTSDMDRAVLILNRPGKLGETGAIYLPRAHRYLMIGWSWPNRPIGPEYMTGWSNKTLWDFYQAPKPWGPWTLFDSREVTPAGYYMPEVSQKFLGPDGWIYSLTAGDFMTESFYHLTVVPLRIDWTAADRVSAAAVAPAVAAPPQAGKPYAVSEGEIALQWIPPGVFQMGTTRGGLENERPVTKVHLTHGYWLGKANVTQAQWQAVMSDVTPTPGSMFQRPYVRSSFPRRPRFLHAGDTAPMDSISWNAACDFCRRLNQREREAGRLPAGYEYRLPTEAEWEYACRAGTTGDYAGDGVLEDMGWYLDNADGRTHPAAGKKPNAWGLYDMHGGIREWCYDWYAPYPGGEIYDPVATGLIATSRDQIKPDASGFIPSVVHVSRGGGWGGGVDECRSAARSWCDPFKGFFDSGFRLALGPRLTARAPSGVGVDDGPP